MKKEAWPHRGPDFNRWSVNVTAFCSRIRPDRWHKDMDLKYLTVRIDTRNGRFRVFDDKGVERRPEDIVGEV